MQVRIAVADPLPAFRLGVLAILAEAGLAAEVPEDIRAWAHDEASKLLLLSLLTPGDWTLLETAAELRGDLIMVALLPDPSVDSQVRALRAGAATVLPRDAETSALRDALVAVMNGRVTLPLEVLRALTTVPPTPQGTAGPTHAERQWLRHLAEGMTVGELAQHAGYSERMMFRLLKDLYRRMGAPNRTMAILKARDTGWLT